MLKILRSKEVMDYAKKFNIEIIENGEHEDGYVVSLHWLELGECDTDDDCVTLMLKDGVLKLDSIYQITGLNDFPKVISNKTELKKAIKFFMLNAE